MHECLDPEALSYISCYGQGEDRKKVECRCNGFVRMCLDVSTQMALKVSFCVVSRDEAVSEPVEATMDFNGVGGLYRALVDTFRVLVG